MSMYLLTTTRVLPTLFCVTLLEDVSDSLDTITFFIASTSFSHYGLLHQGESSTLHDHLLFAITEHRNTVGGPSFKSVY